MKQQTKITKKTVFIFKSINQKTGFNTDPTASMMGTGTTMIQADQFNR